MKIIAAVTFFCLGMVCSHLVDQSRNLSWSASFSISRPSSDEGLASFRAESFYDCDTDLDCFQKYGCGGYADPCEEDK